MFPQLLGHLVSLINQNLPEPHAGLLSGILFGVKASLAPELKNALINSGTLHIVALSGMNISLLAGLVSRTLLRFVSRRIVGLLTIIIIIGFVVLVGISPSVVRAAMMGCIALMSQVVGRQVWPIWSWLVAVVAMLIWQPGWLTDIGFLLSALATLGIIMFARADNYKSFWLWQIIKDDLRVTMAAQVFTIPLLFLVFQRLSLVSPLTNLLIGWTIAPVTIGGFLLILTAALLPPLAGFPAAVCWLLLEYDLRVIGWTGGLPFASWSW